MYLNQEANALTDYIFNQEKVDINEVKKGKVSHIIHYHY